MNDANLMLPEFMKDKGLTARQKSAKRSYIGGSTAKLIWDGEWEKAYDRIMGLEKSNFNKFNIQLGHITERYNLLWQGSRKSWKMEFPTEHYFLADKPYIGALVDAFGSDKDGVFVIDAKHLRALNDSGDKWKGYTEEDAKKQYYWQGVNNMLACKMDRFCLSCVFGNHIAQPMFQDLNQQHADEYLLRAKAFWWHIENKDRPGDTTQEDISVEEMTMREVDMTGNNRWANYSNDYNQYASSARLFEHAKKGLKDLVEKDVGKASGYGIEIKRSKSGSLLFTATDEKEQAA